uniref:CC domain-containing protein n=1 Tax=Parastrongyloides trichosuri TaxID=131310 RepID=A0A0N4Z9V3_PARTI
MYSVSKNQFRFALILGTLACTIFVFRVNADVESSPNLHTETFMDEGELPTESKNTTRAKRQFGCPSNCYSSCQSTYQCRVYSPSTQCVRGCCCPTTVDLDTACDGGVAVAGCINKLCGQGYFCSSKNYCCRCSAGKEAGPCLFNSTEKYCPAGYACNTNNYCCPLGSGSALNACTGNGVCPSGYTCGAGNLCYPVSGGK